jgi:Tfp pilus assembly protein PilP
MSGDVSWNVLDLRKHGIGDGIMRILSTISKTSAPLRTILVLCCVVFLTSANAALSASSGQPPATPSQPEQATAAVPESASSEIPPAVSGEKSTLPVMPPGSRFTDEKIKEALLKEPFSYEPKEMLDPFISFITPMELAPTALPPPEEDTALPPEPKRPLTPLQKMSVAEIERGLKAISWGELGRRAVIEDSAGKGYIVNIGTPAAERNGVITEIFNDRLVIQQEYWDKKAKRMVPQNSIVKLRKEKQK